MTQTLRDNLGPKRRAGLLGVLVLMASAAILMLGTTPAQSNPILDDVYGCNDTATSTIFTGYSCYILINKGTGVQTTGSIHFNIVGGVLDIRIVGRSSVSGAAVCLDDDTVPINDTNEACLGGSADVKRTQATFGGSVGTVSCGGANAKFDFRIEFASAAVQNNAASGSTPQNFQMSIPNVSTTCDEVLVHFNDSLSILGRGQTPPPGFDVSVAKTPDEPANDVNAGQNAVFTIVVTNNGPGSTTGDVTLSDTLPAGFTWTLGGANAASCSIDAAGVLTCNFGPLPASATRTITLTAPTTAADCGTITNTVTVSATGDINSANNMDSGEIDVICGAIRILKNSNKGTNDRVNNAGAVFSITGPGITGNMSVTDASPAAGNDEDGDVGEVCVDGLQPGQQYSVSETSPPAGYAGDTGGAQNVTAVAGECPNITDSGATATFVNPPLGEVVVDFNNLNGNEARADIVCDKGTQTPANDPTPGDFDDNVETYTSIPAGPAAAPNVVTCTIRIDP